MGQQCSCLEKENENCNEKKFENELEDINIMKINSNRDKNEEEVILSSRLKARFSDNRKNSSDRNNYKEMHNSANATYYEKTDNTVNENEKSGKNSKEINQYIIKIITKNISAWFFRKKFNDINKQELIEYNHNMINQILNSDNIKNLMNLIKKCKQSYNLNDWKKYFNEFPFNLIDITNFSNLDIKNLKSSPDGEIYGFSFYDIFGRVYQHKKIFMGKNIHDEEESKNANDNHENIVMKSTSKNIKYKKENMKNYIYFGNVNKYGEKHGKGVLYHLDGSSVQEGTWYNDTLMGWCRVVKSSGVVYEGIMKIGGIIGKGLIYSQDDSYFYEGDLKNTKKDGFGIEKSSEQIYEGEFKDDVKAGKGKMSFLKSGDEFVGEFKDNKMLKGKYVWKENGNYYEGTFLKNKMDGKGVCTFTSGEVYDGFYKNGKKHGHGVIKEGDKIIYEGEFFEGNPHGKGYRYDKKGNKIEVNMEHGKRVDNKNKNVSPKKIGLKERIKEIKNLENIE